MTGLARALERRWNLTLPAWSFPILLVLVGGLAFWIQAPALGFYWDDLPFLNVIYTFGPESMGDAVGGNRPLLALTYRLTSRLAGFSALRWQVFSLACRWLAALSFWLLASTLWPRRRTAPACAALLFFLYPGFQQQPIAMIYGHYFLTLAVFLLSLLAMALAFRYRRWFWPLMALSLAGSVYNLFSLEYFAGLEALRPVLLFYLAREREQSAGQRVRTAGLYWLPFALVISAYLVWRVFLVQDPMYRVELERDLDPAPVVNFLSRTAPQDLIEAGLLAWQQTIQSGRFTALSSAHKRIYAGIVLGTAVLTFLGLALFRGRGEDPKPEPGEQNEVREWIFGGLLAMIAGSLPFWASSMLILLTFPEDRFTLSIAPGASLLLIGLLRAFARSRVQLLALVAILAGFAAGFQYQVGVHFAGEWKAQKDFLWQLYWRAPSLDPGTVIVIGSLPFDYSDDEALSSAINLLYDPGRRSPKMLYGIIDLSQRDLDPATLRQKDTIRQRYRSFNFSGPLSQALVIHAPEDHCLRVIDPAQDVHNQRLPNSVYEVIGLSNPASINEQEAKVSGIFRRLFGNPPAGNWCYFYQKASLAVQLGQWEKAAHLADRALRMRGVNYLAWELVPFIRGYLHTGQLDKAKALSAEAVELAPTIRAELKAVWQQAGLSY